MMVPALWGRSHQTGEYALARCSTGTHHPSGTEPESIDGLVVDGGMGDWRWWAVHM